ncbi:RNA-binding S4 domain-containing protein [Belnapia sp. T6]|uniref:RNA-binding S4 domain-containing protein n=1 Tax=Belnapia mucosa TaxID=2804532 RepID=A0ABS1V0X7_9PROT|nr:RNA-binding S4 domain-containing protein [Belnapia mucosa]MBL6455355.1 RNA-binding S4 domain-containing protein [Belnapia mucosa]
MAETEDQDWQRLDKWLWCARVAKTRAACSRIVETGGVRVNRQPTDKPHYKLRPGDVLTFALGSAERGVVRVWRVLALADRRGPASEAQQLFEDISAGSTG